MLAEDYVRVIMDKTDVKHALCKFEELTGAELLAAAAQTNAIVREGALLSPVHRSTN